MGHIKYIWIAFIIAVLSAFVIGIKIYTFQGLNFVYFYTIIVTTFMFTRIFGSFFYTHPEATDASYEPSISFIIPCKNEEKAIYHTIKKCATVDYPKNKVEIIVINDGSTDDTLNEMKKVKKDYPNVSIKIINFAINKGKREGMAAGISLAKGELIIQLDSDSYPKKDAIRYLVAPFKNKEVAATTAHSDPANKDVNLLTRMQTAYYFMSFRALKATESLFDMVFCCSGCCSAYRREYVLPVLDSWRNESFLGKKATYGDDRALTNKMIESGYKTIYCADAQAYTIVPEKWKSFLKQQIRWKKSWFINSVRASKFMLKKDTFIALTYFFPLFIITLLNPFVAFKALFINPIFLGISPVFYILGVLTVSLMFFAHYELYEGKKYGKYIVLWNIFNMVFLSYIIIYSLFDLGNRNWGTR